MSLKNVVEFWQRLQKDAGLLDGVKNVADKTDWLRQVVQIAGREGFGITPAELLEAEAVVSFWQKVQSDSELQARLKPTRLIESENQAAAEVVKIARDAGFDFANDALKLVTKPYLEACSAIARGELNERHLETVVGGAIAASTSSLLGASLTMAENSSLASGEEVNPQFRYHKFIAMP